MLTVDLLLRAVMLIWGVSMKDKVLFRRNVINGTTDQNPEDISEVIRRHIREMADELGGEIASQLEAVFSNRPLKEA